MGVRISWGWEWGGRDMWLKVNHLSLYPSSEDKVLVSTCVFLHVCMAVCVSVGTCVHGLWHVCASLHSSCSSRSTFDHLSRRQRYNSLVKLKQLQEEQVLTKQKETLLKQDEEMLDKEDQLLTRLSGLNVYEQEVPSSQLHNNHHQAWLWLSEVYSLLRGNELSTLTLES